MSEQDESVQVDREPWKTRLERVLTRVEKVYLSLLRAIILVIATGLIGYAAFLAIISLYRIAQSPESVREEIAQVRPEEITDAELAPARRPGESGGRRINPVQRRQYDQFLDRYYRLFQSRFEPFRQSEDRRLTRGEFNDRFVDTQARMEAIQRGQLGFDGDIADLRSLLEVMSAASTLPESRQRLQRYRSARKVQVCRNVERSRTSYVAGWDTYSTACPNWYENMGCPVRRAVQTPYTARECSMRFPEGTQSHAQIFRAFQDKYFALLSERRLANAARARSEREAILEGIAEGKLNLWSALLVVGGFLVLMFFFLLIAIERHQRRISRQGVDQ